MKSPEQVVADLGRRLRNTWSEAVLGSPGAPGWPLVMPIGQPGSAELIANFPAIMHMVATWRQWATVRGLVLRFRARRVAGTDQELPTHLEVPDLETAAQICGDEWTARIVRGRVRAALLALKYPRLADPSRVLAAVDRLTEVDFDLLCRAADWFAVNKASGLTPRQVPIAGMHAKWLNTRQGLVMTLAGVEDLQLAPDHPARIHFSYLDPGHRAAGGRVHDSATVGDHVPLPYRPEVVIISENKDTAIHFPELTGGVSVEGVGRGGKTVASFGWITDALRVYYWGDLDADGLEILDGFRAAGVPATSILMDQETYEEWERFGTSFDRHGKPLGPRTARPVTHLTEAERGLYHQLISPTWSRHRRVEQERIPLSVALAQVS